MTKQTSVQTNQQIKTFSKAITENFMHTLPQAFFAGVAAITAHNQIPYIGPGIVIALAGAELNGIGKHEKAKDVRVKAYEDTLAQFTLNSVVYVATTFVHAYGGLDAVRPTIGVYLASEFLLSGDNAPIDYVRDGLDQTFHMLYVGEIVEFLFGRDAASHSNHDEL